MLELFPENQIFFLSIKASAKKKATKFRKKLFWIEGRSPDSLTHRFINAKKKAEASMHRMPFTVLLFIIFFRTHIPFAGAFPCSD